MFPGLGSELGTEQFINGFTLEVFFYSKWPWGCHLQNKGERCG